MLLCVFLCVCLCVCVYVVDTLSLRTLHRIKLSPSQFSRDLASLGFTLGACNDAAVLAAVDERGQRAYWRLVKASESLHASGFS